MQSRRLVIPTASAAIALLLFFLGACTSVETAYAGVVPGAFRPLASPAPVPSATPSVHYQDLTLGGMVEFPTDTAPSPTFIPLLMRAYRPQASLLGVALEGYFDEAGLQQTLALHPRFGRRWRDIAWRDVEPKEGQYHWEVLAPLEDELRRAAGAGLTPILNVQMTPKWAQKNSPYACGPIKSEKFGAFADFMVQLVQRYGSNTEYGVRYWQIANEPDVAVGIVPPDSVFGCWGSLDDPYYGGGQYGEMLKVVYPRIKEADPNALVMMGGLLLECDPYTGSVPATCKNQERLKSGLFLEGVLKAGGGAYFDILDIHNYGLLSLDVPAHMSDQYNWSPPDGGTGLPEKVAFVRRVLDQYGFGDKAIMSTELALKCEEPSDECQEAGAAYIHACLRRSLWLAARRRRLLRFDHRVQVQGVDAARLHPQEAVPGIQIPQFST